MNKYLVTKEKTEMPTVVTGCKVIGILSIIGGVILGIVDQNAVLCAAGIIVSCLWFVLGEIVRLLTIIANKGYKLTDEEPKWEVRKPAGKGRISSPDGHALKFTLPATNSLNGSPIQLVRGQLFLHLVNTTYIAMLSFKNSDERSIKSVEFEIVGLDDNNQVVETLLCKMRELNAAKGMTFGDGRAYKFSPDKDHIRKIEVNIKKVTFDDGSEWKKA